MKTGQAVRDWAWWAATFGLIGAVVGITAWRIHTYATGQDPAIYIDLARTILREPVGSDAFRHALLRVAPGYPLLLATAIRLFGELAPFWVNPVCLVIGLGALTKLLIEEAGDAPQAALATLWTCLVLLTGYGLNPHFLLYPFRESPAWCLAIAGLWWTHRSALRDQPGGVAIGGMLLAAACAVREPMIVAAAGAAGWICTGPRWRLIGWLALPFGAAALGGVVFASQQVRHLLRSWIGTDVLWAEIWGTGVGYYAALLEEFHLLGAGLLLTGLWVGRKRATTWWFFLVPALLLVLLHARIGVHRRYVLMVAAFLAPVAGIGFARTVELGQQALAPRVAGWPNRGLQMMTMAVLGLGLCLVTLRLEPWGPQVRRTELRAFKSTVSSFAEPGDRIYTEWGCRHLTDAVGSFTDVRTGGNPLPVDYTLGLPGAGYFLKPLNDEAFYAANPRPASIRMEHLLRYRADLLPVGKEVTIAGGAFGVFRIAPWYAHHVSQRVYGKQNRRLVIWLDLQASNAAVRKQVRVKSASTGEVLYECEVDDANGLIAIALDGSRLAHRVVDVEVSSASVLPAELVCHSTFDDQPIAFTLLDRRLRSVYAWFQPPFVPLISERKHLAQMIEGGTLRLPPVYGDAKSIEAQLTVTPAPDAEGDLRVTYQAEGSAPAQFESSLTTSPTWHGYKAPLIEGAPTTVHIQVEPPDCHGSHLRIEQIKLWIR